MDLFTCSPYTDLIPDLVSLVSTLITSWRDRNSLLLSTRSAPFVGFRFGSCSAVSAPTARTRTYTIHTIFTPIHTPRSYKLFSLRKGVLNYF